MLLVCIVFEGSAMIELAFDIARGANYKFNTAFLGEQASGCNKARPSIAWHPIL